MQQALHDDAQRLIGEADQDIKDAEMLLRHEAYYPLCRLAYLAAEKAMRAVLLGKGQEFSHQANVAALGQQVASAEPALGPLISSLGPLGQFAVLAQTADHQAPSPAPPLYSREMARRALALAQRAVTEVKQSFATRP